MPQHLPPNIGGQEPLFAGRPSSLPASQYAECYLSVPGLPQARFGSKGNRRNCVIAVIAIRVIGRLPGPEGLGGFSDDGDSPR